MKKVLFFLLCSTVLFSCSTETRYRAKRLYHSSIDYSYYTSDLVDIVEADSAFRAGDTVLIHYERYVLIEKLK